MQIGNTVIGSKVYIIAELSANHRQNFSEAVKLVNAAKMAGADAIKTQTYTPDTLTINCSGPEFQITDGIWKGKNLYQLYSEACMPWDWNEQIQKFANGLGLDYITTVYDKTSVDYMEKLNPIAYKIASFELTDIPFLEYVASKNRLMIVSTGMATMEEILEAVSVIQKHACPMILLKCNSGYPAKLDEMNLITIDDLHKTLDIPIGLSDHTLGIVAPITAVTLGACVIEKHLTLSRAIKSPDSEFSLEPNEFKSMITAVREAESCIGKVSYGPTTEELKSLPFRRSLFVVQDIHVGEMFTEFNVRSIRPSNGLHPRFYNWVLGKITTIGIDRGIPLALSQIKFGEK